MARATPPTSQANDMDDTRIELCVCPRCKYTNRIGATTFPQSLMLRCTKCDTKWMHHFKGSPSNLSGTINAIKYETKIRCLVEAIEMMETPDTSPCFTSKASDLRTRAMLHRLQAINQIARAALDIARQP
jgi:hypothetical protein